MIYDVYDANHKRFVSKIIEGKRVYMLSPRLCFFIVFKRDLFVFCDDSLVN